MVLRARSGSACWLKQRDHGVCGGDGCVGVCVCVGFRMARNEIREARRGQIMKGF